MSCTMLIFLKLGKIGTIKPEKTDAKNNSKLAITTKTKTLLFEFIINKYYCEINRITTKKKYLTYFLLTK